MFVFFVFSFQGPLAEKVFKSWNFQKDPTSLSVPDLLEEALLCLHKAVEEEGKIGEMDCRVDLLLVGEAAAETIDISDAFIKSTHQKEDPSWIIKEKIKNILSHRSSSH